MPIWAHRRAQRSSALTREAIVEAAMEIADAEGVDGASIRPVAAALGARTMSLYISIDDRNYLSDQVAGEVLVIGESSAAWREVIAWRERGVAVRYLWIVLMADQVAGGVLITGEPPAARREVIAVIARREREVALRHPWIVDMAGHRSRAMVGPNLLRHLYQAMAALAGQR
ncbi:hypothetical protein [Actinoallomurus acaciae]|uniref:TetR family transcriptional regulator n=1 Tax=Actinoallomurus acaciae TaxID=502577 RepID=A0ABV5YVU8_9ACTN